MRFHFVGRRHALAPLAAQVTHEGARAKVYSPGGTACAGFAEFSRKYQPNHPVDAMIYGADGFGERAEDARKEEFRPVGGALVADAINANPQYAASVLTQVGIDYVVAPAGNTATGLIVYTSGGDVAWAAGVVTEHRFLTGHLGARTAEPQGVICKPLPVVAGGVERFAPLYGALADMGYEGPVLIWLDDGRVSGLRCGVETPFMAPLTELSVSGLAGLLIGDTYWRDLGAWSVAVRASMPPYPHTSTHAAADTPVHYEPGMAGHLWPCDLKRTGEGVALTGENGTVAFATACGDSPKSASARAMRTLRNLDVDALQYRIDIGKGAEDALGGF